MYLHQGNFWGDVLNFDEMNWTFVPAQINDKHQNVIIDWGDGRQTKGYVDENSKKIKSYSTHIYRDEKNSHYKLTVSLENNRGGQAEPVSTYIYVKDKKPIFYPIGQLNGVVGEPVEVYVRFEDPGLDDKFTADFNWEMDPQQRK